MITVKDGSRVRDPRLDRLVRFDLRSKEFPIRILVEGKAPRSYTWRCQKCLDQGFIGFQIKIKQPDFKTGQMFLQIGIQI